MDLADPTGAHMAPRLARCASRPRSDHPSSRYNLCISPSIKSRLPAIAARIHSIIAPDHKSSSVPK